MMLKDKLLKAYQKLYPTGRAWRYVTGLTFGDKVPFIDGLGNPFTDGQNNVYVSGGGFVDDNSKLTKAKLDGQLRIYNDIYKILKQRLPDNDDFDELDASNWERIYGIRPFAGATLEDRKESIAYRYSYPNGILERQHYSFIQEQLQAAGFDLYVHENRFPSEAIETQFGSMQFGVSNFGSSRPQEGAYETRFPEPGYTEICANFLDPDLDLTVLNGEQGTSFGSMQFGASSFSSDTPVDPNKLKSGSFFIGGANYPDMANVPAVRRQECRQLILTLKPTQLFSYNYINYV